MVIVLIILYFLAVIAIGFYSRSKIKTPDDFYVAGKKGGIFQISGSLLATILGSSAILGTLELCRQNGWAAMWLLLCASAGLFILAPISKYVSRYGQFTLPELLGQFFGKEAKLISSVIIPVAWLGIIAAQIIGAAKILNSTGLLDYRPAAVVSGAVFILYTLIGGQKSILKTDLFQAILILAAVFIMFAYRKEETGLTPEVFTHKGLFNDNFTIFDLIILFLTYSTTFIVGPDIYSRIFCARSEQTATKSVIITALILIPFAFILTYIGLASPAPETGSQSIGIILYAQKHMPPWILGLLIASLLAAVMSSADTTLLTASMIEGELIYGTLESKKSLKATKLLIAITGLLSITIAIFVTSIIQSLLLALAFFSGAFFVPTLAGLFHLRSVGKRIVAAMLTGGLLALAGKLIAVYGNEIFGNLMIVFSFLCNASILFIPVLPKKKSTSVK